MSKEKVSPLTTAPSFFIDLARQAEMGELQHAVFAMPTRGVAVNTRHRFYKFRLALIEQDHPAGKALCDFSCSIAEQSGEWQLCIFRTGLESTTAAVATAEPPRHGDEGPSVAPSEDTTDHSEQAVDEFLRGGAPPRPGDT